jgi:hypothetical protein
VTWRSAAIVSMASSQLSNRRYKLPVVRAEEKVECSGIHATLGALLPRLLPFSHHRLARYSFEIRQCYWPGGGLRLVGSYFGELVRHLI